jgi:hypothetical protein
MRSPTASVVVAALALAPVVAAAQQPAADTIAQVNRQHVSSPAQYEAARKKHMAWHKSQGDKWAWNVYEITTGPDTGAYLISTIGHSWPEIEAWQGKLGTADTDNAQQTMGGTIAKTETSYWTTVNAMSRLPQASTAPAPFLHVTLFELKGGQDFAMMAAIGKIKAALEAAKFPTSAIWYRLVSGGPISNYAVVVPLPNMSALGGPTVATTLVSQLGEQKAAALLNELFATVASTRTELLQHRPDLSYTP